MGGHSFELGLVVDEDEELVVGLRQYLERGGPPGWQPDLDVATLLLTSDGFTWGTGEIWGDVGRLSVQFLDAADRLEMGAFGLVRAAYDDQPQPPFLLLEPGEVARLSCFFISDRHVWVIYPSPRLDYRTEELYAYVSQHRDELVAGQSETDYVPFREIPFPQDKLVSALRREAALGKRLYETLGEPLPW